LYGSEAVSGLINIITKNPNAARFQLMHLPPIGELNLDLGFMGNVAKSISTNGCEFFYSNPIDNNNDNFTDVTLQERISVFKNGISIEKQ
jgi:outer membrane receptor for ferrienterochelin and colicins